MKLPSCVLVAALSLPAMSHSEDSVRVEEFKTAASSRMAYEMREAFKKGHFAKNLPDAEVDRLIPTISADYAACLARGYVALAKFKQIPIKKVLVETPGVLVDTRHFTADETNDAVGHCGVEALQAAGIETE